MPLLALGLWHREHRQQPAVVQPGPFPPEDAAVAFPQDGERLIGERISGRAAPAARVQDPAPLQPGDRRADRGLVHAKVGEQADQRRDRHPAALGPRVQPVDGDDQLARLRRARRARAAGRPGLAGCCL
jgi:hypothetical protein